jgi:hypothetical protein
MARRRCSLPRSTKTAEYGIGRSKEYAGNASNIYNGVLV